MFLGHFAVGFAAKRVAPRVSLGWLVAAPLLLDLLWPVLVLVGWEQVTVAPGDTRFTPLRFDAYPISHSLVMAAVWGVILAALCWRYGGGRRGALLVGAGVVSHWLGDAVVHRADLPLYPGGPLVGLGLWNSVAGTLTVELGLFAIGVVVYQRATVPRDAIGRVAWGMLVGFVAVIFAASAIGPPPPSVGAVAGAGLAMWVFPAWAWWLDRHRVAVGTAPE